ncbi:MAG: hypothetical protein B0D91_06670 [Oceanospirillales bacterium LUC14_002_19_P2]|nr:MAG: hypothetical protein B0D91_06670 [Oceanospirillales bacterium LUC14_002_19_P2]
MNTVEVTAPGKIALKGAVDVDTAAELEVAGMALIDSQVSPLWEVDLSAVTRADSAALALLLSWMRDAGNKQIGLTFTGFPDELMALAGVCGVDSLLPMA